TPGQLPGAGLAAVRAEGRRRGPASDCAPRFSAGGGVANKCSGRRDASLFDGVAAGVLCVAATLAADPAGGSGGGRFGSTVVSVLPASGDLRAALDQYRPGRFGR